MNDEIPKLVLNKFNSLNKKLSQFTVIAGIVIEKDGEFECIAIGLGTKTIPDSKAVNGLVVKDVHAEVVCKRNFQRYLLHSLESDLFVDTVIDNSNSTKTNTKKKRLRDGIKFHMYISQAPCGDASMLQLNLSQTPSQKTLNEHKKLKTSHDIVLRGRLDYHEFGRLRTKPGRLDSEISTCLSCSDKIAKWNWLGYQGSLLSLFMEPVYISTIVIGDYFDREQITRSLLRTNGFQPVIQSTTVIFPFSKSQMDTKASDVGYSWNKFDGLECLVKGMKQGSAKVCFKTASLISKVKMAELVWEKRDFALVEFQSGIEYGKLKDLAIEYQERKERLYANEFKGWLVSPKETFLVPFARDLL